uniref:T-box domain-containing protein n=1 Tax=Caenorhabditis tropicalis TaxID=1561998 RepID=A0A1I7SZ97_9PELO
MYHYDAQSTQQFGEYDMAMYYQWQQQYDLQYYYQMYAVEASTTGNYPQEFPQPTYGYAPMISDAPTTSAPNFLAIGADSSAATPSSAGSPASIHPPGYCDQATTSNEAPFVPPEVTLERSEDWRKLHEQTNEMMVTNAGRELFPRPQYKIQNLDWGAARKTFIGDDDESNEIFMESRSGSDLMRQSVLFEYAKIYNVGDERRKESAAKKLRVEKAMPTKGKRLIRTTRKMRVQPHCRYIPELTIYEDRGNGVRNKIKSYVFDETEFIVVTCYKNQMVRKLKSSWNPFVRFDIKEKATGKEQPPANFQAELSNQDAQDY